MNREALTISDEELCMSYINGNRMSFEILVQRWEKSIYILINNSVRNQDEAMDLTQEVFFKAFKGLHRFKGESSFKTWLYRIAINTAIDYRRKSGRRQSIDDSEGIENGIYEKEISFFDNSNIENDEKHTIVREALKNIPKKQRVVILLKEYSDLTFEEISSVISSPVSTVKSRLYKGLENMRSHIEEKYPGGVQ